MTANGYQLAPVINASKKVAGVLVLDVISSLVPQISLRVLVKSSGDVIFCGIVMSMASVLKLGNMWEIITSNNTILNQTVIIHLFRLGCHCGVLT